MLAARLGAGHDAVAEDDDHGSSHRRQRRKARHRHRTGDHKDNRKGRRKGKDKKSRGCRPEPAALTCAGRCARVANSCGRLIDCGPCRCGAVCPVCHTCNASSGQCVPNEAVVGQSCGACRACQGNGACTALCPGAECCDGSTCQPGSADTACGTGGTCLDCSVVPGQTCGGGSTPTPGVCGCIPGPTTLTVPHVSGSSGQTVSLQARRRDVATGSPVPGQPIRFRVRVDPRVDQVDAVTDANGIAVAPYLIQLTSGTYPLQSSFAGSPCYFGSGADRSLVVI